MTRRGVVLFGHGSRDPAWREPMDAVARRIAEKAPGTRVVLGVGKHARQDLPALVAAARAAHPKVAFEVLPSVGELPEVIEVLADAPIRKPL